MPTPDPLGLAKAARQAALRSRACPRAFGCDFGRLGAGGLYDCSQKSLELDRRGDFLAEGAGNAADAGEVWVSLNPPDFPQGIREGAACTLLGQAYTVKKVPTPEVARGVAIALFAFLFRTPAPDAATDETAADTQGGLPVPAGAVGLRKTYQPPDNPSNS